MSSSTEQNSMTFTQTAKSCGLKIAIGVPAAVAVLAGLGYVIEQRESIFNAINLAYGALMYGLTLGGSFWSAVVFGGIGLSVFAWVICVGFNLPEHSQEKTTVHLTLIGIAGAALWLFSVLALGGTFETVDALNAYQTIAVYVMRSPFVIGSVCLVIGFLVMTAPGSK